LPPGRIATARATLLLMESPRDSSEARFLIPFHR
jgi:hypothetical protein